MNPCCLETVSSTTTRKVQPELAETLYCLRHLWKYPSLLWLWPHYEGADWEEYRRHHLCPWSRLGLPSSLASPWNCPSWQDMTQLSIVYDKNLCENISQALSEWMHSCWNKIQPKHPQDCDEVSFTPDCTNSRHDLSRGQGLRNSLFVMGGQRQRGQSQNLTMENHTSHL